ncbi:MAG: metal ABC transporter ATP-binding protein [Eubacteriales bacterium]|nr:metal ABC transporter ATP-binding protein [Eubacteriales bacterium]MDD4541761.1 metal ABC transporter ATP-binding protein [Eubacteriales bacterium]
MTDKKAAQVLIELKDAAFAYDGRPVTPGMSFRIMAGDYVSILGENGSGKTTLLKGLLRMKEPYRGEIIFADEMKKQHIGYLPQQSGLQKDFPASVTEIVSSGRLNRHKTFAFYTGADRQAVQAVLRRLDIDNLADKSFRNLSGGQQQRVLLARALVASDGILILDEPTAGLDPMASHEFYKLIRSLNQEGETIIMVSHDVHCVMHDATHALHLDRDFYFYGPKEEYMDSVMAASFLHRTEEK